MGTKRVKYNQEGIEKLPNDKPVVYKIKSELGDLNYVGTAKRGRVQERIKEHLGEIPGAKVTIEQFSSIKDAEKKETNIINRTGGKYNKQD